MSIFGLRREMHEKPLQVSGHARALIGELPLSCLRCPACYDDEALYCAGSLPEVCSFLSDIAGVHGPRPLLIAGGGLSQLPPEK